MRDGGTDPGTGETMLSPDAQAPVMAILFDLDDTLCTDDGDPAETLAAAFDRAGVERFCDAETFVSTWTEVGNVDSDVEFYREQLRIVAERIGGDAAAPDPDSPALDAVARAYDEARDHTAVSFVPGAEAALEAAVASGRPVGLVTNGSRETQTTKLEALGIRDRFDACVFGEPGRPVKPDPEPFERALAALDADPTDAIKVGDRLAVDVAGANALGIESVWHPATDDATVGPDDPAPDHRIDSMAEFASLI